MPLIVILSMFVEWKIGSCLFPVIYPLISGVPVVSVKEVGTPSGAGAGAASMEPWNVSEETAAILAEQEAQQKEKYTLHMTDQTVLLGAETGAEFAIVVNSDDNEILAAKSSEQKMYPASMTKVMTVLTAAENISKKDLDDHYTITLDDLYAAYNNDCSAVGFLEGDVVTVRDLFYGTILPSGADAASGLANYVAGSNDAFAELMNEEAKKLGISETTHFTNPVGYFSKENYTTAHDMAIIMKAAMENEITRPVMGERTYRTSPTQGYPEGASLSNRFLRHADRKEVPGEFSGAKTGYVDESGFCAVSSFISSAGGNNICVTGRGWGRDYTINEHARLYSTYAK